MSDSDFQLSLISRIDILKRQIKYSAYVYLVLPVILLFLIGTDDLTTTKTIYLLSFFCTGFVRIFLNARHHQYSEQQAANWIRWFASVIFIQALILGSTPFILVDVNSYSDFNSLFGFFTVFTFITVTCSTYGSFPYLAAIFSICAGLPVALFIFAASANWQHGVSMLIASFVYLGININQAFALFKNIFELEKSRHAIQSQDERLNTFINNLPGVVSLFDENLQYKDCNNLLLEALQMNKEDLIGKPLGFIHHHSEFADAIEKFHFTSESQQTLEISDSNPEYTRYYLCILTKHQNCNSIYTSALSIDITKVKEQEKRLELTKIGLIEAEKMVTLGEMASGLAHELNNPMAIISGRVQVILSRVKNDEIDVTFLKENLAKILDTISRVKRIVFSLKAISKNQTDEADIKDYTTNEVLDPLMALNHYRLFFHGIELIIENEYPDIIVRCSLSDLAQVVLHLLKNSVDEIKEKPDRWMKIELHKIENFIQVYFIDCGNGIPKEIADRIFDPYFSTKHQQAGTGVGLAAARDMMRKQGGDLFYKADHPNTCFVIELPMSSERSSQQIAS